MPKYYSNLKTLGEKNGEISFEAEIPYEVLEEKMNEEVSNETEHFSMPGFRKGKVPENIVRQHINEIELLEDAARDLFEDAIKEIINDEKISIIGAPEAAITKIALKSPVGFTVRCSLYPKITLPNYKELAQKTAKEIKKEEVTDKELEEALKGFKKMMVPQNIKETPENESEKNKNEDTEITEDFIKQFSEFKTVDEFKNEIKKQLQFEKDRFTEEQKREKIISNIIEGSKIELPQLLIDEEFYEFIQERDEQLEKAKISLEEYLKDIKKTEKELEDEERKIIENKIKMSFIFTEIRKQEDIKANEEEIETHIPQLKLQYPEREEKDLRKTAEAYIIQEKMFDILEGKDNEKSKTNINNDDNSEIKNNISTKENEIKNHNKKETTHEKKSKLKTEPKK